MYFRFPTCKTAVCIFVFLLVKPVCVLSFSYLSGQCVDFRLPTCRDGVWICVFLLVRMVCGILSFYLSD